MKQCVSLAVVVAFAIGITAAAAGAATNHNKDAIARFYELRERTLDQRGTAADVNRLLALFAGDATYEHPAFGVVMNVEEAKAGMLSHLGEGVDALYRIQRVRFGKDFAVVEATLAYAVDGKAITRRGTAIFEFKNRKIARIAEY